jgi:acyl-CoA synthetase (AMP-forming)/AMP-acid ligase II
MTGTSIDTAQSVPEALDFWAERTPAATALLAPGREPATYRDLYEEVDRIAGELRALGLGRHDGIALLLPEGPDLCVALLASIAVGIAVPLLWPSPVAEHARILANPRVRAVVATEAAAASLAPTDFRLPVITTIPGPSGRIGDLRLHGDAVGDPTPRTAPAPDDIALILHSSGTTGQPKLVPRLHRNLLATCQALVAGRDITVADRCLSLSRSVYSQALILLTTAVSSGSSLIAVPDLDVAALPDWLNVCRPTFISTTPAVLRACGDGSNDLKAALRQARLRFIVSSAGPLSPDDLSRLEAELGTPIVNTYGMTEASFIASEFLDREQRPGAVGLVQCELRTVDENGLPLERHETGEIVIRGPRVFPSYLDDVEANAAAFLPGGWFRTGDVGFVDEAGYLYLTGRLGETINRGGEKILPGEVDAALLSHPAVAAAAVFAVPDALLGQDVVAAVVLREGATVTPRELRRWLLDRLTPYKVPRRIWFLAALPRTATGKVQRGELARQWTGERA